MDTKIAASFVIWFDIDNFIDRNILGYYYVKSNEWQKLQITYQYEHVYVIGKQTFPIDTLILGVMTAIQDIVYDLFFSLSSCDNDDDDDDDDNQIKTKPNLSIYIQVGKETK